MTEHNQSAVGKPQPTTSTTPSPISFPPAVLPPETSSIPYSGVDVGRITKELEKHKLFMQLDHLRETNPQEYQNIRDIACKGRRRIHMATGSVKRLQKNRKGYANATEDTYLNAIMPLVTPLEVKVAAAQSDEIFDIVSRESDCDDDISIKPESDQEWTTHDYTDDGILLAVNQSIEPMFSPAAFGPEVTEALKKKKGMTTAKPNRAFGFSVDQFPHPNDVPAPSQIFIWREAMSGICYPFLIVEGKSAQGNLTVCQLQTRRGGACLVHGLRSFLDAIGEEDVAKGFDHRTYIFSMNIDTECVTFYVHWAEKQDDGSIHYHMDHIYEIDMVDDDNVPKIRAIYGNIMEWGIAIRKKQLQDWHKKAVDLCREAFPLDPCKRSGQLVQLDAAGEMSSSHLVLN